MNPSQQRMSEPRRHRLEAIVVRHVHRLFHRLPMLSAFWLRPEHEAAQLSVCNWRGDADSCDLYELVLESLIDLADEHPEAVRLMCGRTFARAVH
jgi:hypothetical protein